MERPEQLRVRPAVLNRETNNLGACSIGGLRLNEEQKYNSREAVV